MTLNLKPTLCACALFLTVTQVIADDIKVGFIGSLSSDAGRSALRGAEIAIDELNAAG